ncbi:MAG: multicopper oxidase domain-containing protein [Acidobacteria bacterium]|nr:multicopper oxidase domain-containing protein [Acidobacteriota bacterium]
MKRLVWALCFVAVGSLTQLAATPAAPRPMQDSPTAGGRVRTYYIAAEETEWDYAPLGIDMMTGEPFAGTAVAYTQPGPNHIGRLYRKAVYREYADATFATRKPRLSQDEYLGLLGPILRAEVGDTIKVLFKNSASRPYSMHVPDEGLRPRHPAGTGVTVDADGFVTDGVPEDTVAPGATANYEWEVPERAGPQPGDPSSIAWVYYSRVTDVKDVASGLVGGIIVAARGQANADGTPKDVDREIVALFTTFNENQSWYLPQNVDAHISAADQQALNRREANFSDAQGFFTFAGTGFAETNYKFSVNGYLYGDGPVMPVTQGQRVRWYLLGMGDVGALNFHTPHWHGNTVLSHGTRRDTIGLLPMTTETVDMVPDAPGLWMFHCHIDDHMEAGMMARYEVLPAPAAPVENVK